MSRTPKHESHLQAVCWMDKLWNLQRNRSKGSSQSLKTDSQAALACNFIKKVEPVHISCLEYLASHRRNEQKSLQVQQNRSQKKNASHGNPQISN